MLLSVMRKRGEERERGCRPLGARCAFEAILVQVGRVWSRCPCRCRRSTRVTPARLSAVVQLGPARSVASSAWLSFAVGRAPQVACVADSRTECPASRCRVRVGPVAGRGMGTQHHARRPSRALGSSRLSMASGLACVGLGDRRHSIVRGQVELFLSVRRSFLALCSALSVCRSGGRTWPSGSMSSVVISSVWWSCVFSGGLGRAGRRSARLCRWPGSAPCRPGRAC